MVKQIFIRDAQPFGIHLWNNTAVGLMFGITYRMCLFFTVHLCGCTCIKSFLLEQFMIEFDYSDKGYKPPPQKKSNKSMTVPQL